MTLLLNASKPAACVALLLVALGCRNKETPAAPYSSQQGKEPVPTNYPAAALTGPGAASAVALPAHSSISNRPSSDDDVGRAFQGVMELRVELYRQPPLSLRFMSRGNASRLQSEGGPGSFDVLFQNENVVTLNHAERSYKSQKMGDVKQPKGEDVKSKRLDTRQSIEGVTCDDWQLTDGALHIDTCVAGLPGEFNAAKFEAATGKRVPEWLESLLDDKYLPVLARVYDASHKELYSLRLTKYEPGPVDAMLLTVPTEYVPN